VLDDEQGGCEEPQKRKSNPFALIAQGMDKSVMVQVE
jgi:hypothetical protein